MFSFGIFASHTPYIILGGLYFVYMLTSFGIKADKAMRSSLEEEKREIQDVEQSFLKESSNLNWQTKSEDFQDHSHPLSSGLMAYQWPHYKPHRVKGHYGDSYVRMCLFYCLFSRPPPQMT